MRALVLSELLESGTTWASRWLPPAMPLSLPQCHGSQRSNWGSRGPSTVVAPSGHTVMRLSMSIGIWVGTAAFLVGCASDISAEKDALEAAQTDQSSFSFPDLTSTVSLPDLGGARPRIRGTPTQIYTRIARGAVTCWFGAHGTLKTTHVYSAVAKPPSKGGQARILIHKKDDSLRDKRGMRAFAIDIIPEGETAKLEIQNAEMGEPRGTNMAKDAHRWAAGIEGCVANPVAVGWEAQPKSKSKKPKSKSKTTARSKAAKRADEKKDN